VKTTSSAAALLFLVVAAMAGYAREGDDRGRALAQWVYERPEGDDRTFLATMILTEKDRSPRVRRFYLYALEKGPGETLSLVRFTDPGDISGVGLLTLERLGAESTQWLYLPELGEARRIAAARRGGRFVGSDFYYEDLETREPEADHHRLLGEGSREGTPCQVLESVPVRAENSVYTKRRACIHLETLLPLEVDLYEGSEHPAKRFTVHRIEQIQDYWTVMDSTMVDLRSGHRTRIVVEQVGYDRGLPEQLFSRQALEDPAREGPHRLR
jgi:hypothetical protein